MNKILIVDDDATIRRLVQKALVALGFEVAGLAASGPESFECAKLLKPDLVLMDIVMPGPLDGIDAAKKIRAELDIPVVFLTGHADQAVINRAKCAEPFGFIVKPFQDEELKAVIDLALDKQAREARLRQTLSFYHDLTEAAPYVFWLHDATHGRLLYISPSYERVWNRPRGALYENPLDFLEALHPDDRQSLLAARERQRQGQATEEYYRLPAADGGFRWIRDCAFPIRRDGALCKIAGITEDITLQRQKDEALQESERRYRTVADNTFDWEFWRAPDGRYLYVSPACERVTGYPPAAFYSDQDLLSRIIHHQDSAAYETHLGSPADQRQPRALEFRILRGDGETRWIGHACVPVHDENGGFLGNRGSNRDITEQKRTEQELRDRLAELTAIYDHSPLAFFILDSQWRVRRLNAAALGFSQGTPGGMLGRRCGEALRCLNALDHPEGCGFSPSCRQCKIRQMVLEIVAAGQGHRQVEAQLPTLREGKTETITLLIDTAFLNFGGEPMVLLSIQDMTARKQLEQQLIAAQKMEAIGTLAGGIAHDFNNILGGIIGFTELAADEGDPERRQNYIGQVLKAAERAKGMVGQILSFSRHTPQEMKPVDLRTIVRETAKLLRQTLPATIELRQSLPNLPCMMIANPTQIHQILMNLCTNAKQAMGEKGGILTVSLSCCEARGAGAPPPEGDSDAPPQVLLTVSDDGEGIAPDLIDRIFEPFFTTKPEGVGTGLGLSVVYGIVKNHGGRITVTSRPGEGAAFCVQLPSAPLEASEQYVPAFGAMPRGCERVLFVDDEPAMVELGTRMLSSLGYSVTAHLDSAEALAAFLSSPDRFDLVMTDMTMPRLTGQDLARRVIAARPDIPVVLCTGYNEYVTPDQAAEMGIKAFVLKPYTRREIARVIREAIGGPTAPAAP